MLTRQRETAKSSQEKLELFCEKHAKWRHEWVELTHKGGTTLSMLRNSVLAANCLHWFHSVDSEAAVLLVFT